MKTIRWLIYREALAAVGFVTLGFLALFFFFDMVDELRYVGRVQGYQMSHALLYVSLGIPSHLYELLPITVLIGTIFVMARFAQSSEFTIMRTSGLGPWSAPAHAAGAGPGVRDAHLHRGRLPRARDGPARAARAGPLPGPDHHRRDRGLAEGAPGDRSVAVNVRALRHDGGMSNVRIFEFDGDGRLASTVQAAAGEFGADAWELRDVKRSVFHRRGEAEAHVGAAAGGQLPLAHAHQLGHGGGIAAQARPHGDDRPVPVHPPPGVQRTGGAEVRDRVLAQGVLSHELPGDGGAVAALRLPALPVRRHRGLRVRRRDGGDQLLLLNNVFGYAGNLQNWSPWLTAAAPGIIYSLLSLGAFGWLVLRR